MSLVPKLGWLRRSSALRLSLLLSIVFAAGMAVAIFVALDIGEDAVEARLDATMAALAQTTEVETAQGDGFDVIIRRPDDLRGLPRPFEREVRRGGGTVELSNDFRRSETWRVLVSVDSTGAPIMLAVPLDDSEEAQEVLSGILWVTMGVMTLVALALGLVVGVLAQRRMGRIAGTLDRLAAGDLTARTGQVGGRDDLDAMARQVDGTAEALERLVAQTRHLSASIAHDLRTPLARLRSRLEMLPEGEARADALEEATRLSGIFDTIMRVARIEAAQGTDGFAAVDLGELAGEMAETFGPVLEDEDKVLTLEVARAGIVQADRGMLVQAIANLIQNALVHGGPEVTVFVDGQAIGVADNGAGVDPAQFGEILKPMVRLDAARTTQGTGLGLALVRAVADRHGARLDLAQNNPQGLRVTLNFANL